jgi:AraC-like DNA-binding protein
MTNRLENCRADDVHPADALLSLPISRLVSREWRHAAHAANYRATAFASSLRQRPGQLLSWCRRNLNCTPQALLTHLRMLTAVELLCEASPAEVAMILGYRNEATLASSFEAYFGVSMTQARASYSH